MDNARRKDHIPAEEANAEEHFMLRLFIAGASSNSLRAVANVREICEAYLAGRYTLEIVDVHQEKVLAEQEQLIALPMLIKSSPLPKRRLIGDMTNTEKVLRGLGITY